MCLPLTLKWRASSLSMGFIKRPGHLVERELEMNAYALIKPLTTNLLFALIMFGFRIQSIFITINQNKNK